MESVYSKFFNGKPSDFGIGTWNSHPRSINRSASTTCINSSIAPPLPGNLRKRSFYSNEKLNESLRMQLLEAKLNNIEQKDKQIKQLNSLCNSQYLPPQMYYPIIGKQPIPKEGIDPYYFYGNPMQRSIPYNPNTIPMKKIKIKKKKTKSVDEEGIKKLKKKLMKRNYNEPNQNEHHTEYLQACPTLDEESDKQTEDDKSEEIKQQGKEFIKNVSGNVALKLQRDNFRARKGIQEIQKNYNEIKTLLENKLDALEMKQKIEMENLKYALEKGGNPRIKASMKNTFEGKHSNLEKIPDHSIPQLIKEFPKIIEEKIRAYELKKEMEREKQERMEREIRQKVAEEIALQKALSMKKNNTVINLPSISYEPKNNRDDHVDIDEIIEGRVNYRLDEEMKDKEMERLYLMNSELVKREDLLLEELRKERLKREEEERLRKLAELEKRQPKKEPFVIVKEIKEEVKPKKNKKREETPKEEPEEEPQKEEEPPKEEELSIKEKEPSIKEEEKGSEVQSVKPIELKLKKKKKPKEEKDPGFERIKLSDLYPTDAKTKKKKKKKKSFTS